MKFDNQSINTRYSGRMPVRVTICLVLLVLMATWRPALSEPEPATAIYVAGANTNAALTKHMTGLLSDALGDRFSLRPFKPGQTSQDDNSIVITLGPEAFSFVHQESRNVPILALLVNQHFVQGYSVDTEAHLGAILYAPPLIRQAITGKVILPHATRVAMLATPDSAALYEEVVSQLPDFGMEGQIFVVNNTDNLIPTLIRALDYGDFLLAAPDNTIYNPRTIKHILLTTYRRNRIVIGPSQAYVKAGALASTYAPLTRVAELAAEVINDYQETGHFPPAQHPESFRLEVNQQVARSLNIPLPPGQELAMAIKARLASLTEGDDD